MRTSILSMMAAAAGLVGCAIEPEYGTTEQFLKRNNGFIPNGTMVPNAAGFSTTFVTTNAKGIDLSNEFFQDLGQNGRRCVSCHLPNAGWAITPELMQETFDKSDGGVDATDDFGLWAVFRLNDGANSPHADVSTLEARREAYSMLLTKGLIRVGIGIPANAEFVLEGVDDPYGYASAKELSLFRRPLPSTNLKFLSAVMWDGREVDHARPGIHFALVQQSNDATTGHAEATTPLTDAQRESIVAFEMGMHTAQEADHGAGGLATNGATGGSRALAAQDFYIGINDNFGDYRTGASFTPVVFANFDAWANSNSAARAQIARGQAIFNTAPLNITGVGGLNDDFGIASIPATCTFCHNTPNAGNHSTAVPLDIGVVGGAVDKNGNFLQQGILERTPDMPLYTLRCVSGERAGTVYKVTDPGRALISGKCRDIGRFKGPILRGLVTRAPFFHNGAADTLLDVVEFYDRRFRMGLSAQDKEDLAAFLATL